MRPQDIKILGVTVTYNNEDKIPYVMPYYQRMGIDKLIVYDNDSTDRTVEMLSKYPFVEIRSYHTEQYSEDMVLKFKTDVQDEFRGLYDWCVSTYFDEVFYTERNFKEVLYEKMCDGKTVFMKTGLNLVSRHFPPTNNGKFIHENVGQGALWTSDDAVIGIYGNKVQLFNMKRVYVKYDKYGCHDCTVTGDVSEFEDDIAFFHIKFIDFDFIVKSNEEYAKRMGNNGIVCYDYFSKNMESVYQQLENRSIPVETYMKSTMKELNPEQVVFIANETDYEQQIELIDDLRAASESTIERQYGLIFYGNGCIKREDVPDYGLTGKIKILTMFSNTDDVLDALYQCEWRMGNNYMIRDPWVCQTYGFTFKNTKFFSTLNQNLKKAALQGLRIVEIDGVVFSRYSYFISDEYKSSLGCYMIVKNEEATIKNCLDSIIDLCDKIVVVDTGCSDKTMDIVSSYGSKIKTYTFKWCDDFSAARNFAMSKLDTEYSFTTDADEVFTKELQRELLKLKGRNFDNVDCIDLYLLNCNGTDAPTTYLGGRQIVKNYPENIWKYRVHEKLYFKRETAKTIWLGNGYIRHKHKDNANSQSNYNKYAEWYYKDLNTMSKEQFLSRYNGAHYYYYLFYTLRWMDIFRAKQALAEVYNKDRIMSYTEEQRSNLYTSKFISFEELFAYEMLNNCTDYYYMANIANELNEELPKYLLLHKVYEELGHLPNETAYINLSYIAYRFGLMDEFRKITGEGLNLFPQNGTIRYNSEFWVNTVQEKYEKTLVLYSTKHLYDESAYNYFSHMFRKVIITDDTSGNLGHYLINLDEVGQLSRDKAIKEYENILFDRPSDIIRKIGCWS